jgi:hypothetical protein
VPIFLKSGSLNLLEPSRPVKACNGVALPLSNVYHTHVILGLDKNSFSDDIKITAHQTKYVAIIHIQYTKSFVTK